MGLSIMMMSGRKCFVDCQMALVVWSTLRLQGNWTFVEGGHTGQKFVICLLKDVVYSDNTVMVGGVVYPLLNPCHDVMGKTGLVMVMVQGAPATLPWYGSCTSILTTDHEDCCSQTLHSCSHSPSSWPSFTCLPYSTNFTTFT